MLQYFKRPWAIAGHVALAQRCAKSWSIELLVNVDSSGDSEDARVWGELAANTSGMVG